MGKTERARGEGQGVMGEVDSAAAIDTKEFTKFPPSHARADEARTST